MVLSKKMKLVKFFVQTMNYRKLGKIGFRNLHDNLADLRAQVAANRKGILLVNELIEQYTLPVVHAYMMHVQHTAELAVREMLSSISSNSTQITRDIRLLINF